MKIVEYRLTAVVEDEYATDTRVATNFIAPEMKGKALLLYAKMCARWYYGVTATIAAVEKIAVIGFIEGGEDD